MSNATQPKRMLVTDLDGTLLNDDHAIGDTDREALEECRTNGILRVAATGRSLYSANRVLSATSPIDYLVFSSGAGIMDWQNQDLLHAHHIEPPDVERARRALIAHKLDFMLHAPIPDNHHFHYYRNNGGNPDFEHRIAIYANVAQSANTSTKRTEQACQFVAITPDGVKHVNQLRRELPGLNVIRATSPLDGRSTWIEIFPPSVSKAQAAAWVADRAGVQQRETVGVGNDFNDEDLLGWTQHSFVVSNAPEELRARFQVTCSNETGGVAAALRCAGFIR
ncbi:MAG: HAD family phosphatase [Lentisphaerae bacterium]|nr:HAD family phosphatase [Lentisphaerota bacterium]MBT5607875.1 HAD family phosphatase [Lentisphaerota bacterium]MBT7058266.1 HAD family phosphatase [Lentisphaerota bacterium]MBT7842806.1 HAD family phosphatase [Lentisphaerota bacterium]